MLTWLLAFTSLEVGVGLGISQFYGQVSFYLLLYKVSWHNACA